MQILITNDDGISAPGLRYLARALSEVGEVTVVAPDREQSAVGHAITLHKPLRVDRLELDGLGPRAFATNGTPADCVVLGMVELVGGKTDLVMAGINRGANLGEEVLYSGTVSAAMEAAMAGVPACAVSVVPGREPQYEAAAGFAAVLGEGLVETGLPRDCFLNVNVPDGRIRGVEITRLGRRRYENRIYRREDPRGREYYWFTGDPIEEDSEPGTDIGATRAGRISVTPLFLNLSSPEAPAGLDGLIASAFENSRWSD